jgi:hypothetical protein
LTVLEKYLQDGKRKGWWVCKCSCGNEIIVSYHNLVNAYVKSCGCYNKEKAAYKELRPYEGIYNLLLRSASRRNKKIPVELPYEYFLRFIAIKSCHYCDGDISWREYGKGPYNLDRKDNDVGYVIDNIVVCCKRCNYAKSNLFTYNEWKFITTALKQFKDT